MNHSKYETPTPTKPVEKSNTNRLNSDDPKQGKSEEETKQRKNSYK